MISKYRKGGGPAKPHIYFCQSAGVWRVAQEQSPDGERSKAWKRAAGKAKSWNAYTGAANRQVRLFSAWADQA